MSSRVLITCVLTTSFDYQNALRQAIFLGIFFSFCEESLVRDKDKSNYKDCSETHSGSCSQMTSLCKCAIRVLVFLVHSRSFKEALLLSYSIHFRVYAIFFFTRKRTKHESTRSPYENGRGRLLGAQSINTERELNDNVQIHSSTNAFLSILLHRGASQAAKCSQDDTGVSD